jgi:hypothetical protein
MCIKFLGLVVQEKLLGTAVGVTEIPSGLQSILEMESTIV